MSVGPPGNRSPLKDKPLRTPGQSCEERRRSIQEKLEPSLIAAAAGVVLTALEVWRAYANQPPAPWAVATVALAAIAYAGIRVRKFLPEFRNLRLAAEGEKAVGQFLERLRGSGYEVYHDVPAPGFNIDHVLIGPGGIFAIETKTWRKPRGPRAEVEFDGHELKVGGRTPDRDPILQARAQADYLARLVEEGTGRKYWVKPVVLFPGWWIAQPQGTPKDVWVLEPKSLPGFLEHESERLTREEVKLASFHLSRYIRTFPAE
ncbi:nuclease-related domain-containing protein [Usitatibacter palustris]|uniref:NERD domain-containing protein n=1 Tax=Usitatibacter palustris TaxID=2732487 RepID=A0A6M4H7J3_9PROT|nr:nuclease-related domain-containing protein [Usitatibacter palustris]QJR14663.1 hypothetical protein DSM104440_01473 [Usitatibacter palustris]